MAYEQEKASIRLVLLDTDRLETTNLSRLDGIFERTAGVRYTHQQMEEFLKRFPVDLKAGDQVDLTITTYHEDHVVSTRPKPKAKPELSRLLWCCDLVLAPKLRKSVRKIIADQQAHIADMISQGRPWAARWHRLGTWWLVCLRICAAPLSALSRVLQGKLGGS